MNSKLARHLWRSKEVRAALKKEVLWLLAFVLFALAIAVGVRHFTERPLLHGMASLLVSLGTVMLVWVISVVRTVRRVLREDSLL